MSFLKIKLTIIAAIIFAASSAFASLSYEVTVNTGIAGLAGDAGYLYLAYATDNSAVASTATVTLVNTDGVLGAQDTVDVANGAAVHGTFPANVTFANTNSVNDYEQAITFGNTLTFLVSFASTPSSAHPAADSNLSLSLFADQYGSTPLINATGTLADVNLHNDGSTDTTSLDPSTTATPTPIPGALYLLGSGLMGLVGMRRKKQN